MTRAGSPAPNLPRRHIDEFRHGEVKYGEVGYGETAKSHGALDDGISAVVKAGSRLAIWLSTRV